MGEMRNIGRFKAALFFLVSICALGNNTVRGDDSSARLAELQKLKRSSRTHVISLPINAFEKFVERAPRAYTLMVMFSAEASMCKPCGPMLQRIEDVAKEYYGLSDKKKSTKSLFFAVVQISPNDQDFLRKYAIQHVPILYNFRAGTSKIYPSPLQDKSSDNYPIQQAGLAPNQIKEFVNARTGSKLPVVRGGYQIPFVPIVRYFMPLIVSFVGIVAFFGVVSGAYKLPMVWFGLVMLVYIFSVGGGFFSWIHEQPLAVVDKNGITQYIADGSRSQYVAEGFFVSATCVSISVMMILIQELPSVIPQKSGQTVIGLGMMMMTFVAIVALLGMYQHVSLSLFRNRSFIYY